MAFPNLPQSVWNINTVALNRVAANTGAPATPFDLTIEAPINIQQLAINASDLGALYVLEKNSGLYKDTIYDFTRLNTASPELLGCKRLVGAEINIGDIIVSCWGLYHISTLVARPTFLNARFMKPPVFYIADATPCTVDECVYNLIIGDTLTAGTGIDIELPNEIETASYDGLIVEFKCNGPNAMKIVPFGATIDGAIDYTLLDDESLRMVYNATDNNFEVV
jgi:hypothetical protein